ncbi:hypothetical protein [Chengkuizengella sediminis]|uniref:hypothetical protein n=1 Tax=Chengkuizengella sediminis TaxID=1885917 RepID=UPI00138A5731|nr:hypothetical protein [Chengkuizengella sediminis]NDI33623.1 hypothetical protein [Chengkuizengella sediminis]
MSKLFDSGGQYPTTDSIERLAKYKRGRKIFDGKQAEVYERASEILKDTPHANQLKKLYIAVEFDNMWKQGFCITDIARAFKRKPDDVAILVIDRSKKQKIQPRFGGMYGNRMIKKG